MSLVPINGTPGIWTVTVLLKVRAGDYAGAALMMEEHPSFPRNEKLQALARDVRAMGQQRLL